MTKMLIDRSTVEQALGALNVYASKAEHRRTHADDCAAEEAITNLRAALAEPVLQTCNCRWDGETQVQQCTLHEAHVDAIHEWAERAKTAEKKLAALAEPVQEPVASAGLGPLPEPAQPAEPEGYMPGCLWPLPATPDYYTAEQMREYALRAQAEPVQEPDSPERRCGGPGCDMTCCQPVEEPVAWMTVRLNVPIQTTARKDVADEWLKWGEVLPLYTSPPQRKPLTADAMQKVFTDSFGLCPEPGGFLFRVGRAVEAAHKIGGEG